MQTVENQCCDASAEPKRNSFRYAVRRFRHGVSRWVFLYIYCRYCYRPLMRLLHSVNLHYAPPRERMDGEQPDGNLNHWCQWCGLRGTTIDRKYYENLLRKVTQAAQR